MRLAPPVPNSAVTREGDQICVSGLPPGTTTRITLRAGMPGEGGLTLVKEPPAVAIPNLPRRIVFDTRVFVSAARANPVGDDDDGQPIGGVVAPDPSDRTQCRRVSARRETGRGIDVWRANNLADNSGREVWTGTAQVPKWEVNKPARTALPFPTR